MNLIWIKQVEKFSFFSALLWTMDEICFLQYDPFSFSLSTLSFFWTFSFFPPFFSKDGKYYFERCTQFATGINPFIFRFEIFSQLFFKSWGNITLNRERNSQIYNMIPFSLFLNIFICPNFFVFLNFFRVLRKLYFERWMQIAIKCIKGPLHLSFSTFSFSQLFRFFSTFFQKLEEHHSESYT